jgi:hypothetical protein
MKWEAIVKLGCELPEVEEGTSYGTPALKVRATPGVVNTTKRFEERSVSQAHQCASVSIG